MVIDVHARDVVHDLYHVEKVENVNEFAWTSQLRHYWEDGNLSVRMLSSVLHKMSCSQRPRGRRQWPP